MDEASQDHWVALLVMTRLLGAALAVGLFVAHRVTPYDPALIAAALIWTAVSLAAVWASPWLRRTPAVWALDVAAVLWLIWLSQDWRSPFYVFALTAVILPATTLRFRGAVAWGVGVAAAYAVVAILTERLPSSTLESSIRLETAATHVMVPVMIALALAYANELLRRLNAERERAERLAVQTERQRIAWELHDSAKQQVHAAHLVLSSLPPHLDDDARPLVNQVLASLRAATAEMDTSVAELRTPLDGEPVDARLRRRAAELAPATDATIDVRGELPPLPPTVAAHAYRIASEALTNAVRHAQATTITVVMDPGASAITVRDDGAGLPAVHRVGAHGLRTMRDRARSMGAEIDIVSGEDGRGTTVRLVIPSSESSGAVS